MSRKDSTVAHFDSSTTEYDLLDQICGRTIDLFQRYGQVTFDLQQSRYHPQSEADYVPGLLGSLFDALWQITISMESIHAAFTSFATTFRNEEFAALHAITAERIEKRSGLDSEIASTEDIDRQLVASTLQLHSALLDAGARLCATAARAGARPSGSARRALHAQWQNYAKALGDFLPARESLKLSTDEMERKTLAYVDALESSELSARRRLCAEVFRPYLAKMGALGASIRRTAGELRDLCAAVDFEGDFGSYASRAEFRIVDSELPVFRPFSFSSKYTMPDRVYVPRLRVSYFPVRAARARATFRSDSLNEVQMQKGRIYFLMEEPREGLNWILVMACGWMRIGFVPYSFIECVGERVGVLNKSFPREGTFAARQRFVAVLEETEGEYRCLDENGTEIRVPNSQLFLL